MLFLLVTGETFSDMSSFSSSSAQLAQRHLPAQLTGLCTCRFVTISCSLRFVFAFCIALRLSGFGLRSSVISVSSLSFWKLDLNETSQPGK